LQGPEEVLARVVTLGRWPNVDTICVHGDTPGAADLARRIRAALELAKIDVRNFSG
jgi:UPF0271 protein